MEKNKKTVVKEKFENQEYPIHVIGRHVDISDPMKAYAVDKLTKAKRFGGRILDVTIIMDIQKLVHSVDFVLDVNNTKIKVTGRTHNMYASIDQAIARLEAQLRRYHRRLHEHHAKKTAEVDMNVNVVEVIELIDEINDQIEEENLEHVEEELTPHKIVNREIRPLKILNQAEAIMKMDLSNDAFMIYRSEEDQKLKVIYRRTDSNYGIIEVE
ncbi:MAG: Ribosome hibernation promoting factor [Chlamydiae bacterium]|nr:Ribosome hibernation promoting factor [Chlamydiota bacterium]